MGGWLGLQWLGEAVDYCDDMAMLKTLLWLPTSVDDDNIRGHTVLLIGIVVVSHSHARMPRLAIVVTGVTRCFATHHPALHAAPTVVLVPSTVVFLVSSRQT